MAGETFIAKLWRWAFLSKNPVPQKYIKIETLVKDSFDLELQAALPRSLLSKHRGHRHLWHHLMLDRGHHHHHGHNPTTPIVVAHVIMGPRCASHRPNIEPGGDGGTKTPGT